MKKTTKRLSLKSETVAVLTGAILSRLAGGVIPDGSNFPSCESLLTCECGPRVCTGRDTTCPCNGTDVTFVASQCPC